MLTGRTLKQLRKRYHLTAKEVGQHLGVHRGTVQRWEAMPVLTPRIERQAIRLLYVAAREHCMQTVCPTCHGVGFLPRDDAPAVLPRIVRP
jgi:transcriptional regulator with XRE-family HTH domain